MSALWSFMRVSIASFILLGVPSFCLAEVSDATFLEAKKAFRNGDMEQFEALKAAMKGHPLHPYLEYYYIHRHFKTIDDSIIERFIKTHANSPMAYKLRLKLQDEMIENKQWNDYLALYKPSQKASHQCDYRMALHQTGQKQQAFSEIESLWLKTKEEPENCTPLFKLWLNDAKNKDELVWERFDMALTEKKPKLAKSLIPYLSQTKKNEAEQVLRVYNNPRLINKDSFQKTKPTAEVVSFGIARLARISPLEAINTWKKMRPKYQFDEDQEQRIFQAVGLTMTFRNQKDATKWFRKVLGMNLPAVYKDWMMRSGVLQGDWQFVIDSVEALSAEEQKELRWQYWYGRALGMLGRTKESKKVLQAIAHERNYYGFMANHYLNQPIKVMHEALKITPEELLKVKTTPGFKRARLLYDLNLLHDARVELFTLMHHMSEKEQYIVAKLISEWGWHPQALRLSHYADHKDDITVRFPIPFLDTVSKNAKKRHVDPALAYAIMRQESYFTTFAKSPAGAIGLMQLMPDTASITAKQYSLSYSGKDDLLDGEKNIELGIAHLNRLNKTFNSHPALVIAAYNAGKKSVYRWVPKDKALPTDVWVESVRYQETRKYLRNVIACYVVYQHRLGLQPSLSQVMKQVKNS